MNISFRTKQSTCGSMSKLWTLFTNYRILKNKSVWLRTRVNLLIQYFLWFQLFLNFNSTSNSNKLTFIWGLRRNPGQTLQQHPQNFKQHYLKNCRSINYLKNKFFFQVDFPKRCPSKPHKTMLRLIPVLYVLYDQKIQTYLDIWTQD